MAVQQKGIELRRISPMRPRNWWGQWRRTSAFISTLDAGK
jgi:hypothetical protein